MRSRYWSLERIWAKLLDSSRSLNASELASFEEHVRCMTASSRRPNRSGTSEAGHQQVMQSTAMPVAVSRQRVVSIDPYDRRALGVPQGLGPLLGAELTRRRGGLDFCS
jgi:hypothetical protein